MTRKLTGLATTAIATAVLTLLLGCGMLPSENPEHRQEQNSKSQDNSAREDIREIAQANGWTVEEAVPTVGMIEKPTKGGKSIANAADCIWDTMEEAQALSGNQSVDNDYMTGIAWARCNHLMPVAASDTRPGECVRRVQRQVWLATQSRNYWENDFEQWQNEFRPTSSFPHSTIFFEACIPPYEQR